MNRLCSRRFSGVVVAAVLLIQGISVELPATAKAERADQVNENKAPKKDGPGDGGITIQASSQFYVGVTSAGPAGDGYWRVTDGGVVQGLREAGDDPLPAHHGEICPECLLNAPIVGIAGHPYGGGYWLAGRDGGMFNFGTAGFHGSLPGQGIQVNNIVGITGTASGGGYWLVGSDGGVFTFGNAPYLGGLGGQGYTDVVGMAATPSGNGYWLLRSNGAVYAFGDAPYRGGGSGGGFAGMAGTKDGQGYWLLRSTSGANGEVFGQVSAFNAPWYGNGSNCCSFSFSSIVAKRGLHAGYRMQSKNDGNFPGFEPSHSPVGVVEENSYVRVKGYAVDPNETTKSITVQINADGVVKYQQATPLASGDVNQQQYFGISGSHRFEWTVPAELRDGVSHRIVVTALDSFGDASKNVVLSDVTWASPNGPPDPPTATAPVNDATVITENFDPLLTGTHRDPDGNSARIFIEVIDRNSGVTIVPERTDGILVPSGGTFNTRVPADMLANRRNYQWRAKAVDTNGAASTWSAPAFFKLVGRGTITSAYIGLPPAGNYAKTAVHCVTDRAGSEERWVPMYVRARADANGDGTIGASEYGPDRSGELAPLIRQALYNASGYMDNQANGFVNDIQKIKALCDQPSLDAHVDSLTLAVTHTSVATAQNRSRAIANAVYAKGFTNSKEKFIIFYDHTFGNEVGGITDSCLGDPSSRLKNAATNCLGQQFGSFAVPFVSVDFKDVYNSGGPNWHTFLHEMSHAMGAVNSSAPNTNSDPNPASARSTECIDDEDVMCYNEPITSAATPRLADPPRCATPVALAPAADNLSTPENEYRTANLGFYDCGNNDYFNPNTETLPLSGPDAYLRTNWNIAGAENRWVLHGNSPFAENWNGANNAPWSSTKWFPTTNDTTKIADIQINTGRLRVNGSSSRATAKMTPIANSDAAFTYRFGDRGARSYLRVMSRASGATGSAQMQNGYRVELRSDSAAIKLQSYVNGTSAEIGSFTYTMDTNPQRLRLYVSGTTVRVKAWPVGTVEPATWQIDISNDTSISGAGVFQINHNWSSGAHDLYIDDVEIAALP